MALQIVITIVLINFFVLVVLHMIASVRDKRMVEYPWWIILLTFLPLGWFVYYNSMVHADEDERRERLGRLMGDRQTFRVTGDFIDEYEYVYERDVTSFQKGSQFVPDPVFARQVYAELRDVEDRKSSYQLKLETAQREFEDNTDELRELAAKLQAAQVRRNEIAKDIQQYETTLSSESSVDALHDQMVMAEFQSISMLILAKLPGVTTSFSSRILKEICTQIRQC